MESSQLYNIICLNCKAVRRVGIVKNSAGNFIDWLDNNPDIQKVKIYSGRKRLDSNWGWQCICGNDDIMTNQEIKFIENKQSPNPKDIKDVLDSLIIQEPKFAMEQI